MFGNFTFGEGFFGQPEGTSTGTAIVQRQTLTITQRDVTAIGNAAPSQTTGGGTGKFGRYVQFIERVARISEGVASFQGSRLSLSQRSVSVSAGAGVTSRRCASKSRSISPSASGGSRVRFQGERTAMRVGSVMPSGGSSVRVMGSRVEDRLRDVEEREAELAALLLLLD